MPGSLISRRWALVLFASVTLFVSVCIVAVRNGGVFQPLELAHYDLALARAAEDSLAQDVVVVAIGDGDLAEWGWPVPDGFLARVVEAVGAAGAATIGIDLYRDRPSGPGAEQLEAALSDPRVISISKLDTGGELMIAPHPATRAENRYGFSDVPLDLDGVARRALLLASDGTTLQLSFPMKLAMTALGQDGIVPWPEDPRVILMGQTPMPPLATGFGAYTALDASGYQIMTRHRSTLPISRILPARDVLAGAIDAEALRGRIVLIGLISETIKDHFILPVNRYSGARFAYGVQLHAAITQQILDHARAGLSPVSALPRGWQTAVIAVCAALGSLVGFAFRSAAVTLALGLGGLLAIGGALSGALAYGLWLPAVPAMLAWTAGFLLAFGTIAVTARRQRRVIAQLFQSQLSPELTHELWTQKAEILTRGKLIPKRLDVSVLFADVAGSTRASGGTTPAAFMQWISTVLDALGAAAAAHGGLVEKYTGDGILVVFGAPVPRADRGAQEQDAKAACACALAMAGTVSALNATAREAHPYQLRIGLHCGPVLGGSIGRAGGMHYNIIGDTVNVAARIEAFGKRLQDRQEGPATICCSREFLTRAGDAAEFEPAGTLTHDDGTRVFDIFRVSERRPMPLNEPET